MDYIEKAAARLVDVESIDSARKKLFQPNEKVEYSHTRVIKTSREVLSDNRVLVSDAPHAVLNAYKVLRTRVLHRMEQNGWTTLAVTSCGADEGKTLTAINLSISLAMKLEYTVLLVDLDYLRPSVHTYFGFKPAFGLSDYFLKDVELSNIMVNTGIERLVLLPEREGAPNISEHIGSPKMAALAEEFKTRYPSRLVVFDMPPVFVGDDVLNFSRITDATLLVVEEGKTRLDALNRVSELLNGANWLGTVLNKSVSRSAADKSGYEKYGY